jgi:hypothetical protein
MKLYTKNLMKLSLLLALATSLSLKGGQSEGLLSKISSTVSPEELRKIQKELLGTAEYPFDIKNLEQTSESKALDMLPSVLKNPLKEALSTSTFDAAADKIRALALNAALDRLINEELVTALIVKLLSKYTNNDLILSAAKLHTPTAIAWLKRQLLSNPELMKRAEQLITSSLNVLDIDMVDSLLKAGVNPNAKDASTGKSALDYAMSYGKDQIVQLLKQHGAK